MIMVPVDSCRRAASKALGLKGLMIYGNVINFKVLSLSQVSHVMLPLHQFSENDTLLFCYHYFAHFLYFSKDVDKDPCLIRSYDLQCQNFRPA